MANNLEKIADDLSALTVVEAADLSKLLEEKWGVSAAAPAAATVAPVAAPAEEKDEFTIVLKASGDQKINVIKEVRTITGLGLKEAKDIVDGVPKTLKEAVKTEEAEKIKQTLEGVGATVELK